MTWPARTYVKGEKWNASLGNEYLRDPLTDLRAGVMAIPDVGANDFLHASSAEQWGRKPAVTGTIPRFNGVTNQWEMVVPAEFSWPVGSIYKAGVSTNPATLLGFGTWAPYGPGRVTVGIDTGDPDFDTVDETGGETTHPVTIAELPSHTHPQDEHSHTATNLANTIGVISFVTPTVINNSGTKATSSDAATNQNTGGGGAHNNLMPYIVGCRWVRTA